VGKNSRNSLLTSENDKLEPSEIAVLWPVITKESMRNEGKSRSTNDNLGITCMEPTPCMITTGDHWSSFDLVRLAPGSMQRTISHL